ncbi:tyrosine-type recombinase/integrase [Nonomuraea muscovyensis]|uniref:tyrosine-type recombinase/integrase n=1 Tax=Nonomuraea muscovyensis TaxID=1124761 RepID=UPI00160D4682
MEAGLPPVRLHDLRHGAATIFLAAGHDMKVVQETLGLSSITIASDAYTSVLPDLARKSAEDAADIIRLARRRNRSGFHPDDDRFCRNGGVRANGEPTSGTSRDGIGRRKREQRTPCDQGMRCSDALCAARDSNPGPAD